MAGANLSPRQKMINMMYLVLTALLALNVSAEILKAFHMVEQSMNTATVNIDTKNDESYASIAKHVRDFPNDSNAKYVVLPGATKVRKIADELIKYIEEMQNLLIKRVGGRKEPMPGEKEGEIEKADDIEDHANYLINQGHGKELKEEINKRVAEMIACAGKTPVAIKNDIDTRDPQNGSGQTWESYAFEHTPISAVSTLMAKFQNDVKNVEARVLDELEKKISGNDFEFDRLEPKVIPTKGTYITMGSEYTADIFVAASSSKQESSISVNGKTISVEAGIGRFTDRPSHEGEIEFKGIISAKKPNGQTENYEFKSSYTALKPLAVISATKMNVVYKRLENPISVSVPGYSAKEVSVTCTAGAHLKPDKIQGTFICTVDDNITAKEITITVNVKDKDGKTSKKMGDMTYRVKAVPSPTPKLGSIDASGQVSLGVLRSSKFIFAELKGFVFEGVKYDVTGFGMRYLPKVGQIKTLRASGYQLSPEMQGVINSAKPGDAFIFAEIKAKGPNGDITLPGNLLLDVK
ncbi:MAG: gliding motility protein GldM [Bacteroidia bacterium]